MSVVLNTKMGAIRGNERTDCFEFLGVRYARAERFEYAKAEDTFDGEYDATHFGPVCPQTRTYYEHLENPERLFYYKEYRQGIKFYYSEDCLNMNIYTPKKAEKCPVLVFFHGGGFDSGANWESPFDGGAYAGHGVIAVFPTYRVGVLGYMTHEEIFKKYGHEGNFGLDDMYVCLNWIKNHIEDFGGDPDNVTVMGQSAGAISVQDMCLNPMFDPLFKRAIMLSGAGLFPKFGRPRIAETTREYWLQYMDIVGAESLDDLKQMDIRKLIDGIEDIREARNDGIYNTMPVVDGYLIPKPVGELINNPLKKDYMIGYTNNDMGALILAKISRDFAWKNNGYLYYFDINGPGDDHNGAFHSCDLRYVFGTLEKSFRPYGIHDYEVSGQMIGYITGFAKTGNPNGDGRPNWERGKGKTLCIGKKVKMGHDNKLKLFINMITKGNPEAEA